MVVGTVFLVQKVHHTGIKAHAGNIGGGKPCTELDPKREMQGMYFPIGVQFSA